MAKYKNIKTKLPNGDIYDSKKEAERGKVLIMLEKKGLISDLKRQVEFTWIETASANNKELSRKVKYFADFTYFENGKYVVEDVKGMRTATYKKKKKIIKKLFDIDIKET